MQRSVPRSAVSAKTWPAVAEAVSLPIMARARLVSALVSAARSRRISALAIIIALVASAAAARAGVTTRRSHRVQTGESLWKIARAYQCSVDDLRRANRLHGDSIQPGQRLRIPSCKERAARDERRRGDVVEADMLDAVDADVVDADAVDADAVDADAVDAEPVDGADLDEERGREDEDRVLDAGRTPSMAIDTGRPSRATEDIGDDDSMVPVAVPLLGQSFGRPQNGYLVSGRRMPRDPKAYHLRRPERAWGTDHTVEQLVRAIRQVRRRFPRVHPLAIGDLSARHGGPLTMHGSHRSGRDADIGFYFRRQPRGYPRAFVDAKANNINFPATWALIRALCKTADDALGVERIYMTYSTQALFYRLARRHGVPRAELDVWFQYPHGRRANHGIIRHEPGHTEHIHVRFRCAPRDVECE